MQVTDAVMVSGPRRYPGKRHKFMAVHFNMVRKTTLLPYLEQRGIQADMGAANPAIFLNGGKECC